MYQGSVLGGDDALLLSTLDHVEGYPVLDTATKHAQSQLAQMQSRHFLNEGFSAQMTMKMHPRCHECLSESIGGCHWLLVAAVPAAGLHELELARNLSKTTLIDFVQVHLQRQLPI